jgi:hypothetical protein
MSEPELKRNPDGTFPPGVSGNPNGRPKGKTLKEFAREFYMLKTDVEKKEYIERLEKKIPGFAWRMAEGNPHQTHDVTSEGKSIVPIYGGLSQVSVPTDDGDKKDVPNE